uniref:LDL receptor related protein associated protein 1 n=1 Tax=Rousettus aegyptiacus TaxID=9407 RepID=A0A7J8E8F4_ROUAE|nr:LDL receptor related protein associated protein 1 [Rousettus aegyptiacus]
MAPRRFGSGLRGLLVPLPMLLLLLVPWPAAGHGGKYSRERNEPERPPKREPGGEFRMEKLNQLWEKAQRLQLSPVELSELHADLKIQERDEFSWKKLKAEGLDEDGEKEAKLRRSLGVILAKYGLDGRKDARAVSSNSLGDGMEQDSLEDPRLEKLWHKAKTSGKFSRAELDKLWREFQHHREKVREYDAMLGTLSAAEGALPRVPVGAGAVTGRDTSRGTGFSAVGCPSRRGARSFPGVTSVAHRGRVEAGGGAGSLPQGRSVPWEGPARSSCPARSADAQENAIGPVDGGGVREEVLRGRHAELKDRLRGLSQGFDRLRRVSHQGYGAGAEFEEPRVIDLWDLAQSANLTEEELASLREELKHFEVKIEKHNHYQKQLEISHQKLKHVERFGDHEHVSRNKERYAMLEEKTKELGYKVKKHLQDLSSRISRARHNEL